MKLYVCWGTFPPSGHPCRKAHQALERAGHRPQVARTYGSGLLPDAINTPQRRKVKRLTGSSWVPALELDDGTTISGSQEIIAWAEAHPAT